MNQAAPGNKISKNRVFPLFGLISINQFMIGSQLEEVWKMTLTYLQNKSLLLRQIPKNALSKRHACMEKWVLKELLLKRSPI